MEDAQPSTRVTLTLRPATLADAERLLRWRNDPATRAASHHAGEVPPDDHRRWLSESLQNPRRQLFIAESEGQAVGVVRADEGRDAIELSWTVAPEARGRGVGGQMVRLFAERFDRPVRAEVRAGNVGSARIAEKAGMTLDRRDGDVLHFTRPAQSSR